MTDTTLLPGANSPQVLHRLLEAVARGVRTTRGLQEALGVGVQTVRAYVHAASWLALVEKTDPVELSPLGLAIVYAGPRRSQVYARAVWSNPLAADLLMASDGRLPELDAIEKALGRIESGLADATLRRRASAIRGLVAPAVGRARPRMRDPEERQLGLPLDHAPVTERAPALPPSAAEYDPDAYRYVLACLLDHGELSVSHLRALLDRAGAPGLGLGGILDLAATRGDAVRLDDRLIATPGAVARAELASNTASVILSDPRYRAYLADCLAGADDRAAAIRRDAAAGRLRAWDRRLFGRLVKPEEIEAGIDARVLDRPLSAFPVAAPADEAASHAPAGQPFLDGWERRGLRVALSPSFAQLQGGVSAVNRALRSARGTTVGLPDVSDRPVVVHTGIVHPGEPIPRSVPDARTLRQRALMHAPYAAVTAALLLLHRLASERVGVTDEPGEGWCVRRGALGAPVPLLPWIDAFAASRGWIAIRRRDAGLSARTFVTTLEALGIATVVGRVLVLAEPLFAQLQAEAEESEIFARLLPMADAADAALERAP